VVAEDPSATFAFRASSPARLVWCGEPSVGRHRRDGFGVLTQRIGVKMLTILVLVLSTVAVTVFGRHQPICNNWR
jgi:hypothetical protein